MLDTIFCGNKKRLFLTIFGIAVLAAGFWLLQALKAEAADYKFLEVKLDTDIGDIDLYQFHGFDPSIHEDSNGTKLYYDNTPVTGYDCGIWAIEEYGAGTVDSGAVLFAKKGKRLKKNSASDIKGDLGSENTDWKWCNNCSYSNTADDCNMYDESVVVLEDIECDGALINDPIGGSGIPSFDYQDMDSKIEETTGDYNLAVNGNSNAYKPKYDILCAGTNSWKTCEANDCASVVTTNDWACDADTNVWTNCADLGKTCNIDTGACVASLVVTASPSSLTVNTPTSITFTVTDGTSAINGATVNITNAGNTGMGTSGTCTAAVGSNTCSFSVTATAIGTAIATASKTGYTSGTVNINVTCVLGGCSPVPICPANTGNCDSDLSTGPSGCEANLLTDANNCGHCGIKCNGVCNNGLCVVVQGGIIPCGRISDDCDTSWDEKAQCNQCHLVILSNNIIDLLIKLASIIALLAIVVGGFLQIVSSGDASLLSNAKNGIMKAIWGFVIIFIAWVIVNVMMVIFGFIDPLGDGTWNTVNCDVPTKTCSLSCGDGIVQAPEVCERAETFADFQARTGGTVAEWTEMKGKCSYGCTYKCVGDPLESKVGEGCYNPIDGIGNPCQKGKYTCDVDSDTVQCVNIFNNPAYSWDPDYTGSDIYDYCCMDDKAELSDGMIGSTAFVMINPYSSGSTYRYKCDSVCKDQGKLCVGVGLTNPASSCVWIVHDNGATCDTPGNQGANDCRTTYYAGASPLFPGYIGTCTDSEGTSFYVGETGCYCWSP